tara:strand:+ start:1318 stop:1551 length:234 start_codon:yes stop_codon:yes gene_type:complete
MNTPIIWNFDDIESNLLVVEYDKKSIGYFRMNTDEFVFIDALSTESKIPINILRSIVNGYDDALKEAKHLVKTTLSE